MGEEALTHCDAGNGSDDGAVYGMLSIPAKQGMAACCQRRLFDFELAAELPGVPAAPLLFDVISSIWAANRAVSICNP